MSIDAYRKTGQMFINLCQAGIAGSLIMLGGERQVLGISATVWLMILSAISYKLGILFVNRASNLEHKEARIKKK